MPEKVDFSLILLNFRTFQNISRFVFKVFLSFTFMSLLRTVFEPSPVCGQGVFYTIFCPILSIFSHHKINVSQRLHVGFRFFRPTYAARGNFADVIIYSFERKIIHRAGFPSLQSASFLAPE